MSIPPGGKAAEGGSEGAALTPDEEKAAGHNPR